jgi:hypothetical protein
MAYRKIEHHRCGDYGHPRHVRVDADAPLPQVAHHALGGGQPEGATPAEQVGVGLLNQAVGAQEVRLAGARPPTPDIPRSGEPTLTEHHRAAGDPLGVVRVAHLEAGNVRQPSRSPGRRFGCQEPLLSSMLFP